MKTHATQIERRLLKSAVRASGLSVADIAAMAGVSLRTTEKACAGFLLNPRLRRRLESVLGSAVWTPVAEFARQQSLTAWLGFDPVVVNLKTTRARAAALGISTAGSNPSKAVIIARLFAAYDAAHPSRTPRTKRSQEKISTAGIPPTGRAKNQNRKRTP